METLINYIKPELLLLPIILYALGIILTKTKVKNNYIPIILGATGVIVGIGYCSIIEGFNLLGVGTGMIQGLLCAAASTYVNQVIKQMKKLKIVDEKAIDVIEDVVEAIEDQS